MKSCRRIDGPRGPHGYLDHKDDGSGRCRAQLAWGRWADARIGTNNRKSHMKICRTIVGTLVPLLLAVTVVSPAYAQTDADTFLDAAGRGDIQLLRLLLGAGQDANMADSAGNSALMFAAANGQLEAANLLVDNGADVNAVNVDGFTALMMAAMYGNVEVAQRLLELGAERDAQASIGMTALLMAAAYGQVDVVRLLLDNGASVDDMTPDGRTVLMAAAEGGHTECVDLLLERGADPNVEAPGGFTALIAARTHEHTEIAWHLINAGAVFTTRPDVMPELVSNPELEVPDSLASDPIDGSVIIQFIVDTTGHVEPESVKIIETPHEGLNEPVTQVFLGAVYKPAEFEGKPVRMRIRQSMSFGG